MEIIFQIYRDPERWDAVTTCFFIDCAPNIVEYIKTIHNILKTGS